MPVALLIIGVILAIVGLRDRQAQLGAQLAADFSGAGSFWTFVGGVGAVGALGLYAPARDVSRAMLGLIVLVFILSNRGVFANLQAALASPQSAAPATGSSATAAPTGTSAPNYTSALPFPFPQLSGALKSLDPFGGGATDPLFGGIPGF